MAGRGSWDYEHRLQPLLPRPTFLRRAGVHLMLGIAVLALADGMGVAGYHFLARLPWVDAFLNASMILGGMGPVDRLETTGAKIFAALYALVSGLLFIAVVGLVLAPWLHRLLHKLHIDDEPG
jgi:hypothetical protein